MADAIITFDARAADGGLARMIAAGHSLAPALKNIGEQVVGSTRDRFLAGTDPDGQPWKPVNPLYARSKKGAGVLMGTGALSQVFYQLAGDAAVDVGSNLPYARIHNEGGVIKPKTAAALVFEMGGQVFKVASVTMPRRRFLGLTDDDRAEILDIIEAHFRDAEAGP